ncbi:energy transducer TonB [Cystobacter fuscus]|uniref:energy transducer TonB n=1 Tax=Cystobacter fuscus TaxID=43 RepID=UPI002B308BC4|nr:energy transducer TonB [Cystobacter fuscus]
MTGSSFSLKSRLALFCLLAAVVSLGGTGCATASRATIAPVTPAPEPIAEPAPAPEPPPAPEPVVKAERPKASKRAARPASEAKAATRTSMAARAPEPRRPQSDGLSLESGEPVAFDPSAMTRPQRVSGREPRLTPEAQAERVRGTALVRCVVTREGRVTNCRLLNGLPYMNQELLEALSTWHVTPATAQGKPLDVDYTFVVRVPTSS